MSGVSTLMMDLFRSLKASFTCLGCTWKHKETRTRSTLDYVIQLWAVTLQTLFVTLCHSLPTSSQQCMRAMPSDRRIMLSSCRTVILQADLDTPPELSRWRRRLYCSTMNSSDSLEIYKQGNVRRLTQITRAQSPMGTQNQRRRTRTLGLNCLAKSRYLRISSRVYSLSTDSSMRECRSTMRLAMA